MDSHVHLYHWDDLVPILDCALTYRNTRLVVGNSTEVSVVLVLTEPRERDTFAGLQKQVHKGPSVALSPEWQLNVTAESRSLCATHIEGANVFLISGQQIVTGERLEVLAIATEQTITDHLPLKATLAAVEQAGGFPILPWGVGKWLFGRGQLVCKLIRENGNSPRAPFALGDNGGRPWFWSWVKQFNMAKRYGIPIVSGSDPLPCGSRRHAAANFGTLIRCSFDRERPAASLLAAISERSCDIEPFGDLEGSMDFMRDQLALRLYSR